MTPRNVTTYAGADTINGPRDVVLASDYDALAAELAEARKPLENYLEFWKDRRIAALEAALRTAAERMENIGLDHAEIDALLTPSETEGKHE